ncbi:MAG: hypothetical protein EU551_01820 [Promethearchaeota archaeon]|nr:MAG: hypothetical protein EU551_01820 [Candidatus Lokiarchaeota archaeon]
MDNKKLKFVITTILILLTSNWIFFYNIEPISNTLRDNNMKMNSKSGFNYLGAESFTDDIVGSGNPDGWVITKEDYSDYISIVDSYTTHSQVMRINDYSTTSWAYTQGYLDLGSPQVAGSFSFWLNVADESRQYTTPFILAKQQKDTYSGGYEIVVLRTCAYNDYQNIMEIRYGDGAGGIASDYFPYETDTWYRIQIDFRSLNSAVYEDAEVKVLIYSEDHILVYNSGWVAKGKDVDYVEVFSFCTRGEGESHDVYIDALDWSWAPGYYEGRNWDFENGTETENIGLYPFIQTIIVVIGILIFIIYYNCYNKFDYNKKINKI